jgi:hypothetical protein
LKNPVKMYPAIGIGASSGRRIAGRTGKKYQEY